MLENINFITIYIWSIEKNSEGYLMVWRSIWIFFSLVRQDVLDVMFSLVIISKLLSHAENKFYVQHQNIEYLLYVFTSCYFHTVKYQSEKKQAIVTSRHVLHAVSRIWKKCF